jgi:hypothetical protein
VTYICRRKEKKVDESDVHLPQERKKVDESDVHLPQPPKQSSYLLNFLFIDFFIAFLGVS